MEWWGLDWLGIVINTLAIAILPGVISAYGGHLAAETIGDQKRSRKVKLCFWALFAFTVIVVLWQQLRAAEADLDRSTKDTWSQALALSKFPPPMAPFLSTPRRAPTRTYLGFDGLIRFPDTKPLQSGDLIAFNLPFKVLGPNQVQLINITRELFFASDFATKTQQQLENQYRKSDETEKIQPTSIMVPGDTAFFTAFGPTATDDRLTRLSNGSEILYVFAEITYKDAGTVHHTRRCAWLQLPLSLPGFGITVTFSMTPIDLVAFDQKHCRLENDMEC